LTEVNGSAHS